MHPLSRHLACVPASHANAEVKRIDFLVLTGTLLIVCAAVRGSMNDSDDKICTTLAYRRNAFCEPSQPLVFSWFLTILFLTVCLKVISLYKARAPYIIQAGIVPVLVSFTLF